MGSLKRKSIGDGADPPVLPPPPQKQHRGDESASLNNGNEAVGCLHDVSYPEGYVPPPRTSAASGPEGSSKPAKEFPFTLDPFQAEAIKCLDNGESVMVLLFLRVQSFFGDFLVLVVYSSYFWMNYSCLFRKFKRKQRKGI